MSDVMYAVERRYRLWELNKRHFDKDTYTVEEVDVL